LILTREKDEISKEFVETILPIAFTAMFSKTNQMTICANHSLKQLSYICPDLVFPPLIEKCLFALQTLTETHQTTVALEILSIIIFPLLDQRIFIGGKKYLSELMTLTLPGIDVNDSKKTLTTLKFYDALLVSMKVEEEDDSHFFEDWCVSLLDRIFPVLLNQNSKEKNEYDISDDIPPSVLWGFFDLFFSQLSSDLYQICLKKIFNFVSNEFSLNALKNVGFTLLNSFRLLICVILHVLAILK
jgi:hypothetical protein